jgi:hypothetical protein
MIEDMTSLKHAMTQMDAEDPAVAEAAKASAAQILSDAKLSFAKMAELIEQRRLLLRPRIVANIKRMDLPDMLGDAAFRDAGTALRREGQSFGQIAEAIELNGGPAAQHAEPVQTTEALHQLEVENEPAEPMWLHALAFAVRIIFFPVRHPLRFFTVALLVFVLFNAVRGFVNFSQQASGFVNLIAGARQLADRMTGVAVNKRSSQQPQEAAASPTPSSPIPAPAAAAPSPTPSPVPTAALARPDAMSAPPATALAPSANEAAPPSPPSAAASPVPSTLRPLLDAGGAPSRSEANDRSRAVRRTFENLMPAGIRNSRQAGPCVSGIGGCYWGGGRY